MSLKRYILIIIVILLLTQIFRIYNFWVKLANGREFEFKILFSGETENCEYFLNNWQFSLKNCHEYQTGSEIRLIGRLTTGSDKRFSKTKKLHVKVLSVQKNLLTSVMAWMVGSIDLVDRLRERLITSLMGYLPTAHFSLLMDLPFGQILKLPDPLYQQLKTIGMLHIVAASGYNVGLISGLLKHFKAGFGRFQFLVIWIGGLMVYLLFTDRSISIIRAALMIFLGALGTVSGRIYHNLISLTTAVFIILLFGPWLLFSLSFQLSVAATLGLILLSKPLAKIVTWTIKFKKSSWLKKFLVEPLSSSLAAQIATMPILLSYFGEVTTFSFVANLLLWWWAPLLTIGGLLFCFLGLVALFLPGISQIISFYSLYLWLYTNLFLTMSAWLASLPIFNLKLKSTDWPIFILLVVFLLAVNYNQQHHEKKNTFQFDHYLAG